MALKAMLTKEEHSSLPDSLKGEYKLADDGSGYVLDVIGVQGLNLENVSGLKSALEKERQSLREAETRLKAFGDLDPTKSREALSKLEEMANWDPDQKIKEGIAERERQLIQRHEEALGLANGRGDGYKKQLEELLIDNAARDALVNAGGNPTLLLPHLRSSIRMRDVDGKLMAEVFNPETKAARVGGSHGEAMSIEQLVGELKQNPAFAGCFEGTGSTGTGAVNGSTGSARKPAQPAHAGATMRISLNDQDALDDNWEKFLDNSAEVSS